MNLVVQQFQSMTNDWEEDKTDQTPSTTEQEKRSNKKMSKIEEFIKKSKRLDDLKDYHLLFLFPNVKLSPKLKMPTLDKFVGSGCPKLHLKMYMRAMQPLRTTEEMLTQMF